MCHIYRYFRNNQHHFFRYPGGRGSKLGLSIYPYHSPAPAGPYRPQTTPRRRGVIWCYSLPPKHIEFITLLYVHSLPLLHINSEHFQKYERNKNEILWRSLLSSLFASGIATAKAQFYPDVTATCCRSSVVDVLQAVTIILL